MNAGEYPLARPLFMYSDPTMMQSKPQVADFINFFLTYVNEEVIDVGYFPASEEDLDPLQAELAHCHGAVKSRSRHMTAGAVCDA